MSSTDDLRRLLDERGVEWDYGIGGAYTTEFSANGVMLNFRDWRDGVICSTILTPEQAIAATLDSCNCSNNCTNAERTNWTCHVESSIIDTYEYNRWEYELSCGHTIIWEDSDPPHYCPNCGRKVVDA